jgi:multiple sugar transport system substrate-binding protein
MSRPSEQEYLLREADRRELALRRVDRREFITRSLVTGLGLAGVGLLAKSSAGRALAADHRPLTPTFYQWIQDLHPGVQRVNAKQHA